MLCALILVLVLYGACLALTFLARDYRAAAVLIPRVGAGSGPV